MLLVTTKNRKMIELEKELDTKNNNECKIDSNCNFKNIELFSFDIFDTLITRNVVFPQDIFAIMQNYLLREDKYSNIPLYVRENFNKYRVQSEYYQYSYHECVDNYYDCTFDEIYENFKNNFSISENDINLLKELELELEAEYMTPIRANIEKVKELVSSGNRVVLISDMYHSENTIRKWLVKFDNIFENIKIYVSNEYKKKKRGGKLYEAIRELENVEYTKWEHIGDNRDSDFESAKELGINAKLYEDLSISEHQLFAQRRCMQNVSAILSLGCSKKLKLNNQNPKYEIASSITAPILTPYVMWVLDESLKKGYKTLYFIARDGYFLKKIADYIIKEKNIDIKTKYIYGSRLAWQGASFYISDENLNIVIKQYCHTVDFLSNILNVSSDDIIKVTPKAFVDKQGKIKENCKDELAEVLMANENFISLIKEKNKIKYENLIGYLKQEIDFSNDDFAFVDLSGSGVTQNCLASVINQFYDKPINSFYIRSAQFKVEPKNVNRFYFLLRNDPCATLEILARAPHGQTLSYKYNDESKKYIPVFDFNDENLDNWDYKSYGDGIIDFTKEYLKLDTHKYFNSTSPLLSDIYINWLIYKISKNIANELGSIIYSHVGKNENSEFAPKITRMQAIIYCLGFNVIKTCNYKLSYVRSKTSVKNLLDFVKKYDNIWCWLFKIDIDKKKNIALARILGIEITFKKLLGMGDE